MIAALVIGLSTLREALRSRVLLAAVGFVVVLVALAVSAASVSLGDRGRLIIDVGLACQSAVGSLIAVAMTITSFARELERRTAYPVLARPVSRAAFVLGKYLGVVAAMVVVTTGMCAATAVAVLTFGESLPPAFWASLPLSWLETALVAALALMFSSFATPALAATYTGALVIAGNLASDIMSYAARLAAQEPVLAKLMYLAFYALPDLERLSARLQAANQLPLAPHFLAWALVYAVAYAGSCLGIAMTVFTKRRAI